MGETVTYSMVIANDGPGYIPNEFHIGMENQYGELLGEVAFSPEANGYAMSNKFSATITFNRDATAGETLFFEVDSREQVNERYESNNTVSIDQMEILRGDLEIVNVQMEPPTPTNGDTVYVYVDVVNNGPGVVDYSYLTYGNHSEIVDGIETERDSDSLLL